MAIHECIALIMLITLITTTQSLSGMHGSRTVANS
jgi:hypothetical protein